MYDGIAICMPGAILIQANIFARYLVAPGRPKSLVGIELLVFCFLLHRHIHLVLFRVFVRQHMANQAFESDIARGVVAMVMCIDEKLKRLLALFFKFVDQVLSLFREFRIDSYDTVFSEEEQNRSTFFGEDASVLREHRDLERCLLENTRKKRF